MKNRKLTLEEFMYLWYIEYGNPYHYIGGDGQIGAVIKKLLDDGICIYLPNPIKEKSPLYCRFTPQGRMLFLAHEVLCAFRHPTSFFAPYDDVIPDNINFELACISLGELMMKLHELSESQGAYLPRNKS